MHYPPVWVRRAHPPLLLFNLGFHHPDGTKLKALLADRYLYAFGTRITVKKWKHRQKSPKDKSLINTAQCPASHRQR